VDAVARTNVMLGIAEIRRRSPILMNWERKEASRSSARCTTWQLEWWSLSA